MRAGNRPERQDQGAQSERGDQGVLEQLEADVIRGESARCDARADHDGDQQGRSDELGQGAAGEAQHRAERLRVGSLGTVSKVARAANASGTTR